MRILITRLTCVCETLLGNLENNSQALNLTNDQHNCNQKSARMLSKQQYASRKSWTVYANEPLMRSKIVNKNKLTNQKKNRVDADMTKKAPISQSRCEHIWPILDYPWSFRFPTFWTTDKIGFWKISTYHSAVSYW